MEVSRISFCHRRYDSCFRGRYRSSLFRCCQSAGAHVALLSVLLQVFGVGCLKPLKPRAIHRQACKLEKDPRRIFFCVDIDKFEASSRLQSLFQAAEVVNVLGKPELLEDVRLLFESLASSKVQHALQNSKDKDTLKGDLRT